MSKARQFDLQDRLIDYAVRIIALSEALPDTKARKHVASQILRSGTSPAPNYGEAQSAESKADVDSHLVHEYRDSEEAHGTMTPLPWILDIPCWLLDIENGGEETLRYKCLKKR